MMCFTYDEAFTATLLIGGILLILRALPFFIFFKGNPPAILKFAGKYIPAISIAVLFIACLNDKTFRIFFMLGQNSAQAASSTPMISGFISIGACMLLHIWKSNYMLSIFTGTLLYMILNHMNLF